MNAGNADRQKLEDVKNRYNRGVGKGKNYVREQMSKVEMKDRINSKPKRVVMFQ